MNEQAGRDASDSPDPDSHGSDTTTRLRVAVAGASGFVGRALLPVLLEAGHEVRAITRHPDSYDGPGITVAVDVADEDATTMALRGCDVAYYLVHSLDHDDFARRDADTATAFGAAARRAGVRRIVYLGGLGDEDDDLSPHLRSRREVESLLGGAGVPVTTLRAGIVIGHRGASWEIVRNLIEKVPVLVAPTWALTRTQPIALADAVRYLAGVGGADALADPVSRVYEIGGADVLRYVDMISRASAVEGRSAVLVTVPVPARFGGLQLGALIASQALPLLTGVDSRTIRTLLESMRNEVVVRDDSARHAVPFEPMGYDDAVRRALEDRSAAASPRFVPRVEPRDEPRT